MKTFWMKWDINSRSGDRVRAFLKPFKNKSSAYGAFVMIIEKMYRSETGNLKQDSIFWENLSEDTGLEIPELTSIVSDLIKWNLFGREGTTLFSYRVREELSTRAATKIQKVEAGRKGGLAKSTTYQASAKHKQASAKHDVAEKKEREERKKEREEKERLKKKTLVGVDLNLVEFPQALNNEPGKQALLKWIDYKKTRGQTYKTNASVETLLKRASTWGLSGFVQAVEHSIGNNYTGLFPDNNQRSNQTKALQTGLETLRGYQQKG